MVLFSNELFCRGLGGLILTERMAGAFRSKFNYLIGSRNRELVGIRRSSFGWLYALAETVDVFASVVSADLEVKNYCCGVFMEIFLPRYCNIG